MATALDRLAFSTLVALLAWAPLAFGAYRGWPLAVAQLLTVACAASWALGAIAAGRLEWRRTAVDGALGLLALLSLLQLALGPGPLATWALGAPGADPAVRPPLPPLWTVGTVSRSQTARSLLLFLTCALVYVLTVQIVRRRRRLLLLVRVLLGLGAVLAFAGLLDYVTRGAWLARVREPLFPTRLTATFVNPDHFAAWLNMLICLGIGDLLTRSRRGGKPGGAAWRRVLASREAREDAIRRYLPFVGLGLMALALVFTLSRGGIVSLLAALLGLLALAGAVGRLRWSLVTTGALLAVMLAVGAWIGLGPVVARFQEDTYRGRLTQAVSSLGMVAAHPVLGVGLGAYRDAYRRFQPAELQPGQVFYPHAHNDWLQLLIELGAAGALVALWAVVRLARDLAAAHLLGRGRCPVGAGEDEGAQRHDLASVGLGLGGLAAAASLGAHSLFDFGARIPANGILAAACLAIATVALHTRFQPGGGRVLSGVRARAIAGGARAALAVLAVGAAAAAASLVVSPALAEGRLRRAAAAGDLALADLAVRRRPHDPDGLALRGRLRVAAAERAWNAGAAPGGGLLATWGERRAAAAPLLAGGIADLRAATAGRPADPYLQEQLAWAHLAATAVDAAAAADGKRAALAAMGRALALAPENPYLHLSMAQLAASEPGPRADLALRAGRAALARDPALTARLVERLLPLGLDGEGWLQLAPETAGHRLALGAALEAAGLDREAVAAYRAAAAAPAVEPAARWLAARLLVAAGDPAGAVREIEAALPRAPDAPELHLLLGRALAAEGDPRALDAYRRAVVLADARAARPPGPALAAGDAAADALVARRIGPAADPAPLRARRALGEHLLARRLWAPALRVWDEVLAARPEDAAAHHARGVALEELGERGAALEALRRSVALAPRAVDARLRLADLLWASEQYHQAINEWREVVGQAPGHAVARRRLAAAYDRVGQPLEAHRERRRALEIAPDAAGSPDAAPARGRSR